MSVKFPIFGDELHGVARDQERKDIEDVCKKNTSPSDFLFLIFFNFKIDLNI